MTRTADRTAPGCGDRATIEVQGLRKHYGRTMAVDDLSFTVAPGKVTGFVGPNGAGKSTTMRIILGLDAPDAGTALVGGRPYRTLRNPLCQVGALLDARAVHPSRRARDHLLWMAHYNGLPARRVDELLDIVGLSAVARRRAGGFSLGMRQRLGIAGALLGDPPVLMFDEPVNGLDPEGIQWIRGLLRSLAAQGRAVLVSSHLMSELQGTADHLVVPPWREADVGRAGTRVGPAGEGGPGAATEAGGTFTVTGSGDVGGVGVGGITFGDDDIVRDGLVGVQLGLMAVIALGVLFVTSEYKTGLAWTTFTASPRRGRVLAAKAAVLGGAVFAAGMVASLGAFFAVQPLQRRHGFAPPSYPHPSLADGPVLRAVVGTALFLAVLALFSLGVGAVLRRTAGAVTFVIGLVVVPQVVTSVLSVDATRWVQRATPIAGLAIQQTRERHDNAIGPWAGFGVVCAYTAVALGLAFWLLRRRDV